MRFYTKQHNAYGGIDLHARRMSVCLLRHEGESMLHHQMHTRPATFLQAMAPDREDLVVAVDCLLTWSWLADLCAQAQMPFGLGHARYLQAIHGGKAQTDTLEAQNIAVLRRGGRLPQASVDPAAMRATRDLLRRRLPLTRNRAALRAHLQQTNSPDNLPEMGQKLAYKANRAGVVARCSARAMQQRGAVDRALIGGSDQLLRDVELPLGPTATPHDAPPWSRRQAVPGIGKRLRVVLRYELQAMSRFPRVQDGVSDGRLGTCAQPSAGKRDGTSGAQLGKASLTWAFSEAAVLLLRTHPVGQPELTRVEKQPGPGHA